MSCYGHRRITSPHMDQLATEGALFTHFYSPHIPTFPGHTTMFTGRDIYAHRVTGQAATPELDPDIPTLAEIFEQAGYFTAAADNLGRWFQRGFQRYETYSWDTSNMKVWRKGEAVAAASLKVVNEAASQDKPFFLFLHFWDTHTPYLPPAPFSRMFYEGNECDPDNRSMEPVWQFDNFKWYFNEWMPGVTDIEFPKAQYDAEVAYSDACLAHVLTRLQELKLDADTMIVLTADHGEELDEHSCWFDHHGLYDTNLHVPLIMRWPGHINPGQKIDGIARMQDITPTVLAAFGLWDRVHKLDGESLLPILNNPQNGREDVSEYVHITENTWMKKRGLRTREWKLIQALEPDIHGFPTHELYHLAEDPGEKRNLAVERPEVVAELMSLMEDYVSMRLSATGHEDPLPVQPIPLHHIGHMETAVPKDSRLEEGSGSADQKLPEGDFKGYERAEDERSAAVE